ncbi:GntR family transcriptional regulator [Phaeobacter sp. B1627]|nr:GntR family transcriptional regulator [Phaeobacter sp. B1627]TNJ40634.1 GntR family transcriptional regulator [Phaeobacter sp. B1627]
MEQSKVTLEKIENAPQTLRDIVQNRLREAILSGQFAPGARLVERPLCEQLGVSRTVVRETIRYLEAEGLVEIIPNRGPVVATLSWDQAKQVYDIRRQLEGAAAVACAQSHGSDFAPKLSAALAALQSKIHDTEWRDFLQATTHFYELIFAEAGHSIAWEIVQRLNGRISRLRTLTLTDRTRERSGMSHMVAIHDAILGRDPLAAQQAVEDHIADAAKVASRFLQTSDAEVDHG